MKLYDPTDAKNDARGLANLLGRVMLPATFGQSAAVQVLSLLSTEPDPSTPARNCGLRHEKAHRARTGAGGQHGGHS